MKAIKKDKSMLEVTKGYEAFIAAKDNKNNGSKLFEKVLNKATKKTKPRGSR